MNRWLLLCGLSMAFAAQGQTLDGVWKQWEYETELQSASWSFAMRDVESGELVYQSYPDKCLPPASGIKAITTLAALELLGPKYQWTTRVMYDGELLGDSVITGNLYVTGGGDPTLGSSRVGKNVSFEDLFAAWANTLYDKGIRSIKGMVVGDASYFTEMSTPGSWNWDDIGQYYGAGSYGLNIYENSIIVYYSSTTGSTRIDSVYPPIEGMDFRNLVTVNGNSDNAYIYGAPGQYMRYIAGTIPANRKAFKVDGSMPDPPQFAAEALLQALKERGIAVEGAATTNTGLRDSWKNADRSLILEHKSPALDSVVLHTNMKSINLYAETLLKTLGKELKGVGSTEMGAEVVMEWLRQQDINMNGLNLEDGSGLSRFNTISAAQMTAILVLAQQSPYADLFYSSLPTAGKSGTLKSIGGKTAAEGRVHAKSGSMQKIRSYSGYVEAKNGKQYAFSIIVNNYAASSSVIKKKLEALMVAMVNFQ
jgi:serine-type D-Ala-D-Ala carboxypeptidase/endopeptidase (penicillin-binding protein 4)